MTVNRNCCSVSDSSSVCPPGDDYQQVDRLAKDGYRITYYRCKVGTMVQPSINKDNVAPPRIYKGHSLTTSAFVLLKFSQEDLCNDQVGDEDEDVDYGTGALVVEGNRDEEDYEEDEDDEDDEDDEQKDEEEENRE